MIFRKLALRVHPLRTSELLPAEGINEIEEATVRSNDRSTLVVMSSYNGEKSGPNYEFLQRGQDYHYHSGKGTNLHCAGYSRFEPGKKSSLRRVKLPDECWPFAYFYPEVFHQIRTRLVTELHGRWNYRGGVDLLLFSADPGATQPVNWRRAAVVSSLKLVGGVFANVDEMIRTIINLNEQYHGQLLPDNLDPEINRRVLFDRLKNLGGKVGGGVLSSAITLIF